MRTQPQVPQPRTQPSRRYGHVPGQQRVQQQQVQWREVPVPVPVPVPVQVQVQVQVQGQGQGQGQGRLAQGVFARVRQ